MVIRSSPIPLRPDPFAFNEAVVRSLCRACIAAADHIRDRSSNVSVESIFRRKGWDDDRLGLLVTRAATVPASMTQTGWAAELATVSQAFLTTLAPMSAGAALLRECLTLSFDQSAHIRLPTINPGVATFVSEGQPIRVSQLPTAAGPTLEVFKLATIVELSREMVDSSNAEALMRQALVDSTGPGLDAVLLSNSAAVAGLHPAGILVGATSVTASTLTPTGDALVADIGALTQAISPYVGNGSVVFIGAPAQAARLALAANDKFTVLMSSNLAIGTIVAIATNALVSAVEPVQIDGAKAVSIQEGDPAGVVMTGQTRSLWQTDSIALRLRWPISWIVRDARAVALATSVKW
jgi:hypothetical protein